jgi:hypothetical protein
MDQAEQLDQSQDWPYLVTFFPEGWQQKAKDHGALLRCRKFKNAEALLRTLLIHLGDGCSLRETAVRAKHGHIVSISDVALLKRLRASGEWLRWMAEQVMLKWIDQQPTAVFNTNLNIRIVDGSTIQEPGATGSTWRIHYSIGLPTLHCGEVHLTTPKVGESLKRFTVNSGDLIIGDRGYANRPGIAHVVTSGGEALLRLSLASIRFVNKDGSSFKLIEKLRTLTARKIGDWDVWIKHKDEMISGRICAIRKNKMAAEKAKLKSARENSRKGAKVRPETIESAAYTFVFTTLDRSFKPTAVLEMYRGRWQIELVFKRLKSIVGLGHLKKKDFTAAQAWLHGKLFVAFLIEALIVAGERFFPWGYPICEAGSYETQYLEGDIIDAPYAKIYG